MAERTSPRVSLGRALSKLGHASRSSSIELIRMGRVKLNGKVVTNPSVRCNPGTDRVQVDGKTLRGERKITLLLNKPIGVITTRSDERGRATVYDALGEIGKWLFPVGRLDKDTTALIILTNDTRLGELLTNPRSRVPKTYLVELDRRITDEDMSSMSEGMLLGGVRLLPAVLSRRKGNTIEITIVQGKNRQIRRMCGQLGYEVLTLNRIRIGSCELGGLREGEWRHLSKEEVDSLYSSAL